jgi:secondary thiamine-phosphate synthase enzyme
VEVSGWARQDSNLGPTDYESAALTAELRARPRAEYRCGRFVTISIQGQTPIGAVALGRTEPLGTPLGSPAVKVFQRESQFRTAGGLQVRDITDEVNEAVHESGITSGIACVYSPHTTCCVRVNEFEQGFLEDFATMLKRIVPSDGYYAHDDWGKRTENICDEDAEFGNGHAHCMSMLLGSAGESIPVAEGRLQLGTWQRVLFLELDRERDRRWVVQVVGA